MGKFDKFCSEGIDFKIENGAGEKEVMRFKPLGAKYMRKYMDAASKFPQEAKELGDIPSEVYDLITELLLAEFKVSYPEEKPEDVEQLCQKYFFLFMEKMFIVNSPEAPKEPTKKKVEEEVVPSQ